MKKYFAHSGANAAAMLLLLLLAPGLKSQTEAELLTKANGSFQGIHYDRSHFKGDPQFWTVCEDSAGVMYFGNNDGGLVYDGEHWQTVELPNKSSIRSIINAKGKIYAGGFNEFGTIERNPYGEYTFRSLVDSLNLNEFKLEMVWQIHAIADFVILRTFKNLIVITDRNAIAIPASSSFINAHVVDSAYYVQSDGEGLQELNLSENQVVPFLSAQQLKNEFIVSLHGLGAKGPLLAVSGSGLVFRIDQDGHNLQRISNIFSEGEKDIVTCGLSIDKESILLGTLSGAIYTLDHKGKVNTFEISSKQEHETTVLQLYTNADANLWILLNNGLNYVNLNASKRILFEDASVYDVLETPGRVFLATNRGVFRARTSAESGREAKLNFENVEGLEGQAWTLSSIEGHTFVCHDKGLFEINEIGYQRIGNVSGVWKIKRMPDHPGQYLVCTYDGLYTMNLQSEKPQISSKIKGFDISSRDIAPSDKPGEFWVCHGYDGVYRIKLNEDLTRISALRHFTSNSGLSSHFNVNVFDWKGATVFSTNNGIYQFNEESNRFEPYAPLNSILNTNKNYRKILEANGHTWFIEDDALGYFETDLANPTLHKELFMELKGSFNRGMECLLPLGNDKIIVGTNAGLFRYAFPSRQSSRTKQTLITGISYQTKTDSSRRQTEIARGTIKLPPQIEMLKIEFAAPAMDQANETAYSHMLEGVDNNWSAWHTAAAKEYSHLPHGDFNFLVKSKSIYGEVSEPAEIIISVSPIWHQTYLAKATFALLAILFLFLGYRLVVKRLERENAKDRAREEKTKRLLELEVEQLKLEAEKKAIKMKSAKLEDDLVVKRKELANYTMQLVKKKEVFTEIQSDLSELRASVKTEKSRNKISEMFQKLHQHKIGEPYLTVFDVNFEQIHHDFFEKLKLVSPDLTKRELRVCAFIKMNLTNKEISPLLNISVRGVETIRYRIRKKLALESEHNLAAYLTGLIDENAEG